MCMEQQITSFSSGGTIKFILISLILMEAEPHAPPQVVAET